MYLILVSCPELMIGLRPRTDPNHRSQSSINESKLVTLSHLLSLWQLNVSVPALRESLEDLMLAMSVIVTEANELSIIAFFKVESNASCSQR